MTPPEPDFFYRGKPQSRELQPDPQPIQHSSFYPVDRQDSSSGSNHRESIDRPRPEATRPDFYQQFWDRAVLGMYRVSVDGQFLAVNPAYAQILEYSDPDYFLKSDRSLAQNIYHSPTRWGELLKYLQQENTVQGFESPVLTQIGTVRWVTESIRLVSDEANGRYSLEGIVQDITSRKARDLARERESMKRDRFWWTFWQTLK
jgi:PAS domain S-box-containing protein